MYELQMFIDIPSSWMDVRNFCKSILPASEN